MLYIDDLVEGTIKFLEAEETSLSDRVYNIQSCSFTVSQAVDQLSLLHPGFQFSVEQDFRQAIVDTWPSDLCDQKAREDWKWNP